MEFKKVLIAVDSGLHSEKIVEAGVQFAKKVNAKIALVHVMEIMMTLPVQESIFAPPVDVIKPDTKAVENMLRQLTKPHKLEGKEEYFIREGTPKLDILDVAAEWKADMIIAGTHGRTGLGHFLLGSVAEYIVRHSHVPVIIIPLREEDKK